MKIACIGGGPAGLYLGILVKRSAPEHEVVVYERNRPNDTFGFGVVFSDATLDKLAAADPESHASIASKFARWDDIEIHMGGEVLRSTGHGFCGVERKTVLQILQDRARDLGVRLEFERTITSLDEVRDADVVVACDGVASWVRDTLATELAPKVDVRPNRFVWLGTTVPYEAFTFLFEQTPHGLFRVHAYLFHDKGSTFIVECRDETWRAAGLDEADEDQTIAYLEGVFARHLGSHRLVKNRSIWRSFPTVRCGKWHAGNVVLVGDAAHTAHFSIGSGTKLAMEDAIALRDELLAPREAGPGRVTTALAAYEARRRPEVEALQAAAQASLEWFEGTERYMGMAPVQFTYSLMTRSLRVSHASVAKRDPHLAAGVEQLLAASSGLGGVTRPERMPRPAALPYDLGERHARSRIAVAPDGAITRAPDYDDQLVALGGAAAAGAGLVVTPPLLVEALANDDAAVAWQRIVEYVHNKGALAVARLAVTAAMADAGQDFIAAVQRAGYAGFDLLLLDPAGDEAAIEHLPALLAAAARVTGRLAAVVHDRPHARAVVVGQAAQLVRAGAALLWVTSSGEGTTARLPAATLSDRLRNELAIATIVDGGDAVLSDCDAAIAAGRADFVVVRRVPSELRQGTA